MSPAWRLLALLAAAGLGLTRGFAYLPFGERPNSLPGGLDLISTYIPLTVWAVLWCVVGLLAVASIPLLRLERWAWAALVGMLTLWGLAYVSGWLLALTAGEPSREWLNAGTYLFPALIILAFVALARPPEPNGARP